MVNLVSELVFLLFSRKRVAFFGTPGRFDHYYQNKGEYDLNQSNVESFVERVAKNNRENNSFSHKIH